MTQMHEHSFIGNPVAMGFEIERLVNEGWEIDPQNPLTMFGFGQLECRFVRDPANAEDAPPKKTRAEILAAARAAKAAKAAAENKEGKDE